MIKYLDGQKSQTIESFPLTVRNVVWEYTKLPPDSSHIFYHYTTHAGLEGILQSGGLRATFRLKMNDQCEFAYARDLIYAALRNAGKNEYYPRVAHSLSEYTLVNLKQFLQDTSDMARAYCACLSVSPDDLGQWNAYAESGTGFAIGLNFFKLLQMQRQRAQNKAAFIVCTPVIYDEELQRALVSRLLRAGISDLHRFSATCSSMSQDLTALRDRIMVEIIVCLFSLIDFIKAPAFSSEREIRLFLDPNNGTFKAPKIESFKRGSELIPFIFVDLRNPQTGRLFLEEIRVGPKASFFREKLFLEDLLDELGYQEDVDDRPQIMQSLHATS